MSDLQVFNTVPAEELRPRLLALTHAPQWAEVLLAGRPYADFDALLSRSDELITALPSEQIDSALAGHPRIGENAEGLDTESAARSAREQSGMSAADAAIQMQMARGNADYERRFGRIYLVAAAGRSAEEMVDFLHERLDNPDDVELDVVRVELARITRTRITELVRPTPADTNQAATVPTPVEGAR